MSCDEKLLADAMDMIIDALRDSPLDFDYHRLACKLIELTAKECDKIVLFYADNWGGLIPAYHTPLALRQAAATIRKRTGLEE